MSTITDMVMMCCCGGTSWSCSLKQNWPFQFNSFMYLLKLCTYGALHQDFFTLSLDTPLLYDLSKSKKWISSRHYTTWYVNIINENRPKGIPQQPHHLFIFLCLLLEGLQGLLLHSAVGDQGRELAYILSSHLTKEFHILMQLLGKLVPSLLRHICTSVMMWCLS